MGHIRKEVGLRLGRGKSLFPLLIGLHEETPLFRDVDQEEAVARDFLRIFLNLRYLSAQAFAPDDIDYDDEGVKGYAEDPVSSDKIFGPVDFFNGVVLQAGNAGIDFVIGKGGQRGHIGAEPPVPNLPRMVRVFILRPRCRGALAEFPHDVFRKVASDLHILKLGEEFSRVAVGVQVLVLRIHRDEAVFNLLEDPVPGQGDDAEEVSPHDIDGQDQDGEGGQDRQKIRHPVEEEGQGNGGCVQKDGRHDRPEVPPDLCLIFFPVKDQGGEEEGNQDQEGQAVAEEREDARVVFDMGVAVVRRGVICHIVIDQGGVAVVPEDGEGGYRQNPVDHNRPRGMTGLEIAGQENHEGQGEEHPAHEGELQGQDAFVHGPGIQVEEVDGVVEEADDVRNGQNGGFPRLLCPNQGHDADDRNHDADKAGDDEVGGQTRGFTDVEIVHPEKGLVSVRSGFAAVIVCRRLHRIAVFVELDGRRASGIGCGRGDARLCAHIRCKNASRRQQEQAQKKA